MLTKNSLNNGAISQIIGEIFLLAIAVTAVSVLFTQVLSVPGPQETTEVTIIGKIEVGFPTFDLQRGESLGPNSTIKLEIFGNSDTQPLKNYLGNQDWNIGEQIIREEYAYDPINPPQVEATIVDTKTNAIVFWGILQQGLTTGHKGGIWHLDEQSWIVNKFDVKDSSGNKNNGTAINGAQPQSKIYIHGNAGNFTGYIDHVRVNTSWTLNITKSITIETWMRPQPLKEMDNLSSIPLKFGYTPVIIPAVDDIYVIVSEDYRNGLKIATIKIEIYGNMTVIDTELFGGSTANILPRPMITQMTEEIYLVTYIAKDNFIHLKTFNISDIGNITAIDEHILNEDEASNSIPNRVSLQKITTNHCAIAYWMPDYGGVLRNVTIDSTGNITQVGNIIQYDPVSSKDYSRSPFLINITGDVFALAYTGPSSQGILKTFNITSEGNITNTPTDVDLYETGFGYEPSIVQVSGNVYAIAYRNNSKGCVKTYQIFANGSIQGTNQMMVFEEKSSYDPRIIHGEDDIFVIAYATDNQGNPEGYAITLRIWKNGSISPVINSQQFKYMDEDKKIIKICYFPIIQRVSEDFFVVSYTGTNHEGVVIKIFVPQARFSSDKGITKIDAYGIYADTSRVWGSINNVNVSYPILPGLWYHFALTYDGKNITLYIHDSTGVMISNISRGYTDYAINSTTSPLFFGRYYSGYIDEIAIYDEALTKTQIQNHVDEPGSFDNYLFR